jgi:ATP-binding cassette subfamily B protein/ATP-binding cassette subfamily C protein
LINDISLENIDQKQLRKMIGVVSQDVMIFEDTIRYNLNLGNDYSGDEIYSALDAVKLLDVINALPNGIDTVISSTTHNLSGGQKQRLMIARMLLRKPSFIILDEATSSLDVETEKFIIQMLNEKMMDATVIVISHRYETIRNCQRIVVLNDHTVEAIGAHESLMEDSATYKALYGR